MKILLHEEIQLKVEMIDLDPNSKNEDGRIVCGNEGSTNNPIAQPHWLVRVIGRHE